MDRMTPLDAMFLYMERPYAPLHVGSVYTMEGPALGFDEFRDALAARVHLVPRYRQVMMVPPGHLSTPVWVDDPHFKLDRHLRHTALPAPGSREQLRTMFARFMEPPMDLNRSPWEMWLVEGLEGGQWGIFTKIHHVMIDGISGVDILSTLFDATPEPTSPPPAPEWNPEPLPSTLELVRDAAVDAVRHPAQRVQRVVDTVRHAPDRAKERLGAGGASVRPLATGLIAPTEINLNGPLGPYRSWDWATLSMDDVKAVKNAHGVTVNDVVQSLIARGFGRWLPKHGYEVEGKTLTTMVPVSMRPPEARGQQNNMVAMWWVNLPVGVADPVEQLVSVSAQQRELKKSGEALTVDSMFKSMDLVPTNLLALGMRGVISSPQTMYSTVSTNVPGPPMPVYLQGRQLLEVLPMICLFFQLRLGMAIVSYAGQMFIGVTGEAETFSHDDISEFCRDLEAALAELVAVSEVPSAG